MVIAKKDFWEHLKFDNQNKTDLKTKIHIDNTQLDKLKAGYIPDDISSRYLAYFENATLFIHSVTGGDCYYELKFDISNNDIFCRKITKYTKFRPDDSLEQTISFIKSFLNYNLNLRALN